MRAIILIVLVILAVRWYLNKNDVKLPDAPRQVVERAIGGSSESDRVLRRPESMTPEQRQLAAEWGNGSKQMYVDQAEALERQLSRRMDGGYVWGPDSERRARAALRALNDSIDRDDFLVVPRRFSEAKDAVRLFEAGCRWRSGMRHSSIPHIHSGVQEGQWDADSGWCFPSGNPRDVARICQHCNGCGRETVNVYCDNCNGAGWVDGPLAGVTRFLDGVAETLNGAADAMNSVNNAYRAAKGKRPKGGGPSHYHGPQPQANNGQIPCNKCNRTGQVQIVQTCSVCGGNGWTR